MSFARILASLSGTAAFCGLTLAHSATDFTPPSIDDKDKPALRVELPVPTENEAFVARYITGQTGDSPARIAVKELGYILRPAMVQVAVEGDQPVTVSIVKKHWDDVVREGQTRHGRFTADFKTAMEFGIVVRSETKGIRFSIAVSAGRELFEPGNLFYGASSIAATALANANSKKIPNDDGHSMLRLTTIALILVLVITYLVRNMLGKRLTISTVALALLTIGVPFANADGTFTSLVEKKDVNVAGGFADVMLDYYMKGGFDASNPLSDDDSIFEPDLDPAGGPKLPSSCPAILRSERPIGDQSSAGSSTGKVSGAFAGSAVGGTAAPESAPPADTQVPERRDETHDTRDAEFEVRRQRLLADYTRETSEAFAAFSAAMLSAESTLEKLNLDAARDLNRQVASAMEKYGSRADKYIEQAQEAYGDELSANRLLHAKRVETAESIRDKALENAEYRYQQALGALEHRSGSRVARQGKDPSVAESKKDPGREPKKRPPASTTGKQADSFTDANVPPGNSPDPDQPSHDERQGCSCLEEAYEELTRRRYSLEKLLKIGQHTKRVIDFSISFGDNVSGVHAVSGLAWQSERRGIMQSKESFDHTYQDKHEELIGKLHKVLLQIDECERMLGTNDWYSSAGFIYYEFMKERYRSYE